MKFITRYLTKINKSYVDGDRVGNGCLCNNSIVCCCSFTEGAIVWLVAWKSGADETCLMTL